MPLVVISHQPVYFPDIFEPGYIPGEHGVINPATGVEWGAYGLTVIDAQQRSDALGRLWQRSRGIGSALSIQRNRKKVPVGETGR